MNANELADELKTLHKRNTRIESLQQAATMLRQQQAEIEALIFDISNYVSINTQMLNELEDLKEKNRKELTLPSWEFLVWVMGSYAYGVILGYICWGMK